MINKLKSVFQDKFIRSPLVIYNRDFLIFWRELNNIEKIQYCSRKKFDLYQNYKLRKLINYSYYNIRFYRKWFRSQNLYLNEIKTVSDIKKLPILTKEFIKKNFQDFISINFKKHYPKLLMTSGSSGIPFRFFIDKIALIKENASYWRQWRIANIKFRDRIAVLRGTFVNEKKLKNGALWKYSFKNKALNLNSYHMNENNCIRMIQKILEFRPHLFQVYPMALYILAQFMKKFNIEFPSLKLIHFSSEGYASFNRDFIKKQFKCPILDRYGQSECVLSAFECMPENGYHIEEENNILELLDKNNDNVSEGEEGRIIGTNLHNFSMPLIRYSTEDLAIMGNNECVCGRQTQKLKLIQGRILDQIITEDKSIISGISLYHYWKHRISEQIPNVEFTQLIQPKINELTIRILPNNLYSNKDEFIILNELKKIVGNLNINFEYINEKPNNNKWRFAISKIPIEYFK